jgi:uncharacterized membrane protein YeaQ/YmgE (transglycosylase-associated protein family)
MEMIISLISGAVGGNAAGSLLKNLNLGVLGNSIAGIVGGGAGGAILSQLGVDPAALAGGAEAAGLDIGSIVSQGAGGLVGGGGLMAIVGVVKNMMAK